MTSPAYRRIAIPVDDTATSKGSVRWALGIALRAACPVDLIYISSPESAARDASCTHCGHLEHLVARCAAIGIEARTVTLEGRTPDTISTHLKSSDADLVVMTRHERGRLHRMLVGRASQAIIRETHVPVLLVPQSAEQLPIRSDVRIESVLVALDGSEFSASILPHVERLATVMHARVTLLGVVHPILAAAALAAGAKYAAGPAQSLRDMSAAEVTVESEALERGADVLRDCGIDVGAATIADAQPGRAIAEFARMHAVDVLAMATHGRRAMPRLMSGSVADAALRASSLPALLYRPPNEV